MIVVHLKDGRTLSGELTGDKVRFVNGENSTFVIEMRSPQADPAAKDEWQTILIAHGDTFGFAYDDEHLKLAGSAAAPAEAPDGD